MERLDGTPLTASDFSSLVTLQAWKATCLRWPRHHPQMKSLFSFERPEGFDNGFFLINSIFEGVLVSGLVFFPPRPSSPRTLPKNRSVSAGYESRRRPDVALRFLNLPNVPVRYREKFERERDETRTWVDGLLLIRTTHINHIGTVYPAHRVADVASILARSRWDDMFEAECKFGFLYTSAFSFFELLAILVPNHGWFRVTFRRAVQFGGRADSHCDTRLQWT